MSDNCCVDQHINLTVPEISNLTNLSKSCIADLEFEVAHKRSTYPTQIEKLHLAIIRENIQSVKNHILSLTSPSDAELKTTSDESIVPSQEYNVPWDKLQNVQSELQVSIYSNLLKWCNNLICYSVFVSIFLYNYEFKRYTRISGFFS